MSTATDFVKASLRRINSYQSGEQLAPADLQDCLDTFNDLLDSWSAQKLHVFGSNENILSWIVGQNQYKVGNPLSSDIGLPNFTGTASINSNVITGMTQIPAGLVSGTSVNAVGAGSTLIDTQNLFPANTYVTAIGANTVTVSANAIGNSQGPDSFAYTLPGDFPIPRPLRLTSGYTRINQLDFTLDVCDSQDRFNEILYKAQPGPWPVVAWYNNQFPYGILNVYQTPGQSGTLHLFTDTILQRLTATSAIVMPQGYARALKWCLAVELWPEYHGSDPLPPVIAKNGDDALKVIKALNAQPAVVAKYDQALVRGNRPDGSWITHGGYR
jgi:hypothetical protein